MKKLLAILLVGSLPLVAQAPVTNEDIIKLAKSGLSESFILNVIDQQTSNFSTDVGRLIELKRNGVSENVIQAVARKTPPVEPLTSDGLVRLVKAQFSDRFLLDLLGHYPVKVSTDPYKLAEMKREGVGEAVLAEVVRKSPSPAPITPDALSALARAGFSENFLVDAVKRQPPGVPPTTDQIVQMKQAGVNERVLDSMLSATKDIEIPSGTEVTVRLIDSIDSEKDDAGASFRASLDAPVVVNGETIAPKGADATVKLIAEDESGKFRGRTVLTIELSSIQVNGQNIALNTTAVSEQSASRGAQTAKTAAAVGAVGAIIGAIAGGGKGAAIGAASGAGAGAGAQIFLKGERVRIPSESRLTFTTQVAAKVQ